MDWHEILIQRFDKIAAEFMRAHPEFSVDPQQPAYRGGTNLITMAHRGAEPIVFKYLDNLDRYQNELFCLRHFEKTGLVPRVIATASEKLIVMERLHSDGRGLDQLDAAAARRLSKEVGAALAMLGSVPLIRTGAGYCPVTDFTPILWGKSPRESIQLYLNICRRIQQTSDVYRAPFFSESLRLIEAHVDHIATQREILFHEDIGNFTVCDGSFTGFFDLEMCRGGVEAMQLGVALGLCLKHLSWPDLLSGYEEVSNRKLDTRDLLAVLSMQHFYHWIRVCRWGSWNGDPEQKHHRDTSVADCDYYLKEMTAACRLLQPSIDLESWFPSIKPFLPCATDE